MMNARRRPGNAILLLAPLLVVALLAGCRPPGPGGPGGRHGPPVRLNEIQVLASHNSYHVEPEPTLFAALRSFLGAAADGLQYTHRPLAEQLDAGVRAVELDVFADDADGGTYADPALVPLLGLAPVDPAFQEPGLKVFHIQEVDYRSTCTLLAECLGQIRAWSDAHPGHLPITIQIEAKDGEIADPLDQFVTPVPWLPATFTELEHEIRSVFPDDRVLAPADVRGRSATLRDAVLAGRWPRLDAARGQVLFVLDDKGAKRDAYRAEVPDLADRSIFVDVPEADPDAGITIVNDAVGDADRIRELVAAGFIVRTRADADTVEARSGDTTRRDAALASGAQYVSTDYVWPDDRLGTGYAVDLPGDTAARCNPVSAPRRCEQANLAG
jgi:hypothetical protein